MNEKEFNLARYDLDRGNKVICTFSEMNRLVDNSIYQSFVVEVYSQTDKTWIIQATPFYLINH